MRKWTMRISAVLDGSDGAFGMWKAAGCQTATDETAVQTEEVSGDEEIPSDIPNSFVEEQAGKTEFDSYDELISNMTAGQAYAYVTLTGYEGDVLLITDQTI